MFVNRGSNGICQFRLAKDSVNRYEMDGKCWQSLWWSPGKKGAEHADNLGWLIRKQDTI